MAESPILLDDLRAGAREHVTKLRQAHAPSLPGDPVVSMRLV